MSPILPPGTARVVLLWGARPSDLDIYMLAPHADPTKEACEVRWLPVPAPVGVALSSVTARPAQTACVH